jgi:hypothetical protein
MTANERKLLATFFQRAGKLGGLARAKSLAKAERSAIAKLAADARWDAYRKRHPHYRAPRPAKGKA